MLEALPEPGREFVLNSARRLRFGRGEMILSQGSPSASLLIIESGRVSIHNPLTANTFMCRTERFGGLGTGF